MLIILMDERDILNRLDMRDVLIKDMQNDALNGFHHCNLPLPVVAPEPNAEELGLPALYPLLAIQLDGRDGLEGLDPVSDLLEEFLLEDVQAGKGVEVEDVDVCGLAACCYETGLAVIRNDGNRVYPALLDIKYLLFLDIAYRVNRQSSLQPALAELRRPTYQHVVPRVRAVTTDASNHHQVNVDYASLL